MRNLRGTGGNPNAVGGQQPTVNPPGVSYSPVTNIPSPPGRPSEPIYTGNLSGAGPNVQPTRGVVPERVPPGQPGAAAVPSMSSKPVVQFVPKSISLFDAFKFNGPAPELIQGRLAMVGFLAGSSKEAETGMTLLQQATHLSVPQILGLLLIVVASLQPIRRAAKSEPFGVFTPRAEITNGRAAMLGFAIVAALEWNAGVCFF